MKPRVLNVEMAVTLAGLLAMSGSHADQQLPPAHATDFTSSTYYEPPHEQQVKLKLSGAESLPLPGAWQDIRQLKIETFAVDGKPEMIVRAPQCNFAPLDGVANSAGPIELQTGDGKFHLTGEGFLWRQEDNSLTISNNVHTVIQAGTFRLSPP